MTNLMDRATESEMIRAPLNEQLIGTSASIQAVNGLIRRLAQSSLMVLITGESGTGKEIAARLLHRLSPRGAKPFIKVNCPAIPESILESELFGFERGAFTGARGAKPGRFELAHHGSIFLDEIAETPPNVQAKLLQVLDGEPIMRIGGVTPVQVDVRIIAATNLPLEQAVRQGRLREDIYFRLSEMVLEMPPLRDRSEDIPVLAEHFNYNNSKKQDKEYKPIPQEHLECMKARTWEGNVRELGAQVKKYVATGDVSYLYAPHGENGSAGAAASGDIGGNSKIVITAPAASKPVDPNGNSKKSFPSLKEATREAVESTERSLISEALQHTLWNRRKAARLLDISYSSLLRRIEAYNIGKDLD